MATRTHLGTATAGLTLFVLLGTACDLLDFDRQLDGAPPRQDMPAEEMPPFRCAAAVAEATPEYEAMCRHYCGELEATLTYGGYNTEAPGAVSQSCYELRCAPRCVTQEVCVSQCHAIGVQYQALCGHAEIAPGTVCPVSLQDRVDACLVGCGVPVAPPDPTTPPDVAGSKEEGARQAT
jgi:hypothetical protein